MKETRRAPLAWWWVVLIDIGALGAALVVFALFHHVLPRRGEAKATVVSMAEVAPISTPAPAMPAPAAEANAAPEPTPQPTYAPGDFTATFPTEDTGDADVLYTHQSDNVRIAARLVRDEENRITSYVADIWVRNIQLIRTAFAKGEYGQGIADWPLDIAQQNGALLAVTGDYYGARNRGVVIRNGVLYRDEPYRDVCVLYVDGSMETYTKEEFDVDAAAARGAYQAWGFGPALVRGGVPVTEFKTDEKLNKKNPRCGIGYYEPGHYCLVVIDGRQGSYSKGMTLVEMGQFFYAMGCKEAYNLDGGKTSAMMTEQGLLSQPFEDGRQVSDIVYIAEDVQ